MLLRQYRESVAAVLLDLVMPVKDGYAVLEEMRQAGLLFHIPVVVITAEDSTDNRVKVFELGVSDIIPKPFEPEVVKSRVRNIIELSRYRRKLEALVEEQSLRVRESNIAVIDMLSSVIEYRSLESGQHIRRIRMFTKILLEDVAGNYKEYDLDARKIRLITESSSMHDIGKIAIPDSILNKPGRLTPEEFEIMKTHTVKGCEILSGLDRLQDREYLHYAYQICRYHHERWDGGGYPDGLKGNNIPLCAQVVAIADCYDALTTDRVYKKAIPPAQAFSMILNGECGAFAPRLLECFKNVREPFARLSREYADGAPVNDPTAFRPQEETSVWETVENTSEKSQLKYFTLLRYLDCTVMEADLNTGMYHLVYMANPGFASLRSGSCFEESIHTFIKTAVHPDDREQALHTLDKYIKELFEDGMMWRERSYRILDGGTGEYVWHRASLMRISLEDPCLRQVLVIWRKKDAPAAVPENLLQNCIRAIEDNPVMNELLGGVQKCLCDQHFTLLHMSKGLLDISGYGEQEIHEKFQNQLIRMMYPADRDRIQRQYREQRNEGRLLDLEYRLMAKSGTIVWFSHHCMVVVESGFDVMYGILLDITQSREAEEELRLSLERHSIIMSQTNDIIFEWDIEKDELYFSSSWEAQYGYVPITKNVRVEIPKASHIHPGDMPAFVSLMDAMAAGVPYKEIEFRIADAKGTYRWRRVRATAQFDLDGKPSKAVGVILDIDIQKRTSSELEKRKSCDLLTGLYNKETARMRVESYLSDCGQEDLSALMVMDMDDFKQINSLYGHMYGDAVLTEISDHISKLFRGADTVARIGGDEFLVFMPGIGREEVAEHRAADMLCVIGDVLKGNPDSPVFSGSIGITFSHGRGNEFQTLFSQADRALSRAKAGGKNRFERYRSEMDGIACGSSERVLIRRTGIDSNGSEQWNLPYLIIRIFDILYETKDFSQAVHSVLALIGGMFGVSRTYLFESSSDMEHCSNTYEWCGEGVISRIRSLQNLSYLNDSIDYRDHFKEDGLFCCRNIRRLDSREHRILGQQGILSTLQYAIRENGKFYGFVGFDDCKICRLWTREQMEALTLIGKLLSVFLMKDKYEAEIPGEGH